MTRRPPRLGTTRLVAVDGPAGAGKSTFAKQLADRLQAQLIKTDHFATWEDPVTQWWPRLTHALDAVAQNQTGRYRKTDWSQGFPRVGEGPWVEIEPQQTIILEGMSSTRKANAHRLSIAIWIEHGDEATRLERAVARDGEQYREQFVDWQNFERGWFAVDDTRARADYVVTSS